MATSNIILHKIKLVKDPMCLYCGSEESPIHACLECENVTNYLWRSIELWSREMLNQHVEISEIDKIFGINNDDILVNTVILAAKEVIYIKRKTGGPLSQF